MRKSNYLFPVLALGLTAVSCQDYDAGFTEADFKVKEYADNFKQVFGDIDPNQDWSMAQQITASINVPGAEGATLRIMTASPMSRNCYMLAKRNFDGNAELNLDVVKGTKNVYVEVKTANGRYLVDGYFDVVDGKVIVDKYSAMTRAGEEPATEWKLWTKDTGTFKYNPSDESEEEKVIPDGYLAFTRFNSKGLVPTTIEMQSWATGSSKKYDESWDYSLYEDYKIVGHGDYKIGKFYTLKNVDLSQKSDERDLGDMYPLYYAYKSTVDGEMKNGPFLETENHVKRYLGETPKTSGEPTLEKDAKLETKGGEPVTITFVGKGTEMANDVGYFYYPKANEADYYRADGTFKFEMVNKFILVEGMADQGKNLMVGTDYDDLANKSCSYNTEKFQSGAAYAYANPGTVMYKGAVLTLKYYGDGDTPNATGTDFPANYIIGFFGIRTDKGRGDNNHIYTSFATTQLNYFNDYPRGASFKYKGKVFLGLEDDQDYDINDFLFEIGGVATNNLVDLTPDDDPDYEPEPTFQTWTVACEDLGGYFDYDFNDLVFGLRLTDNDDNTTKKLELIPLAAGGTLEAHVLYNSEDKGEIHALVTPGAGYTSPINVGAGSNPGPGASVTLSESTTDGINEVMAKISVKVTKESTTNNSYNIGFDYDEGNTDKKAPQVILFPTGWDWPSEGTFICYVYPKFAQWTSDADVTDWCNDRTGEGGFVNCPFSKVVPPTADPEEDPITPPNKSACNLNIITNVKIVLPGAGGTGSVVDHYTTSSTGAVTAASNNDKVSVVVDQSAKTVTISATEVVEGVTVTVSQEADENYEAGTKTITVSSIDPSAGPSFTIGGTTVNPEDVTLGKGSYTWVTGNNFVYTIDEKLFTGEIAKITITLTSVSDAKLNAEVMNSNYSAKQNNIHTIEITESAVLNAIEEQGLTIIDWAIPYPENCDKIGSVNITIE